MADSKITGLTADTSPTSDDLTITVTDPAGTPVNRKVTAGNLITKAHGLSDGVVSVSSGVMTSTPGGVVAKSTTTQQEDNPTTEVSVLSVSIPGNSLGANGMLRVTVAGRIDHATVGTTTTITIRIKFGSTTLYDDITQGVGTTGFTNYYLVFYLYNNNSTSAQRLNGQYTMPQAANAATSGNGDFGSDETLAFTSFSGSSSEDTTTNKTLAVTFQNTTSDTDNKHYRDMYLIEQF